MLLSLSPLGEASEEKDTATGARGRPEGPCTQISGLLIALSLDLFDLPDNLSQMPLRVLYCVC